MLLPDGLLPENSIYYNGSIVLEALQKNPKQNLLDLFQKVKHKRNMSFAIFVLSLDWLFLIDTAKLNINGEVELCS